MKYAIEILSGAVLAASLVFGGASKPGLVSDAVPQLLSLPLLVLVAAQPRQLFRNGGWPLLLLVCAMGLLLLQLVPLPPGIWTKFPGRSAVSDMYAASGITAPWLPTSLSPGATSRAALSLLPAASVFLGTLCLDWAARRRLAAVILSVGLASVLLDIVQKLGGSPAKGFFYNQNHNAALLYALLPFSAALFAARNGSGAYRGRPSSADALRSAAPARQRGRVRARGGGVAGFLPFLHVERHGRASARPRLQSSHWGSLARNFLLPTAGLMLLLGAVMTASRLGVVLAGLATIATLWIYSREALDPAKRTRALLWGAFFLALMLPLLLPFGLVDTAARVQSKGIDDLRWQIYQTAWTAAVQFFPVGSGVGSFERIYQTFERPETVIDELINNAHNDWLELLLEGGLPALFLMAAWLTWLGWKSFSHLSHAREHRFAHPLESAALVALWLLALHSLGDYPLRTTALNTLFAFSCGLLCRPGSTVTGAVSGGVADAAGCEPAARAPDTLPVDRAHTRGARRARTRSMARAE